MNAPSKKDKSRLSVIHVIGIIFALGLGILVIIAFFESREKDRVEEDVQQVRVANILSLAKNYYGNGAVNAGTFGLWTVLKVTSQSDNQISKKINNFDIHIAVDDRTFQEIQGRSPEGRFRAAANGCPPIGHEIYRLLTNNDNLTLRVEVRGSIFIDVDCARWVSNIGPRS